MKMHAKLLTLLALFAAARAAQAQQDIYDIHIDSSANIEDVLNSSEAGEKEYKFKVSARHRSTPTGNIANVALSYDIVVGTDANGAEIHAHASFSNIRARYVTVPNASPAPRYSCAQAAIWWAASQGSSTPLDFPRYTFNFPEGDQCVISMCDDDREDGAGCRAPHVTAAELEQLQPVIGKILADNGLATLKSSEALTIAYNPSQNGQPIFGAKPPVTVVLRNISQVRCSSSVDSNPPACARLQQTSGFVLSITGTSNGSAVQIYQFVRGQLTALGNPAPVGEGGGFSAVIATPVFLDLNDLVFTATPFDPGAFSGLCGTVTTFSLRVVCPACTP